MMPADLAIVKVQLERDEGRRHQPYEDSRGVLTVGIGRNLRAKPFRDDEIDFMFGHDVDDAESAIAAAVPFYPELDPVRQRVLINMTFNMGARGVLQFHDMLQALSQRQYDGAAAAMLASRWASQVGARADRLASMMRSGVDA
ncbi:MAG TPA: glycoside hydrolase family protein [Vicinamibacterales bacterium]|nr:glycoside hydrolase family protein [Vicinamibacterales bacterium]